MSTSSATANPESIRWSSAADALVPDGRQLLGGSRQPSADGTTFELRSPRDGTRVADIAACGIQDVNDAIRGARRAFESGEWSRAHPKKRRDVLLAWADAIAGAAEELALLIALEMGKPIRHALTVELRSIVQSVRWYGEVCDKLSGGHPAVGPEAVALVDRDPAGVVAIVLPWNFPLSMVGYDVGPALCLGNSVVIKPSERAPLSVLRCCELAKDVGLPEGVLSVLPGGAVPGEALGRHHDVDVVAVTGRQETGRAFLRYSADSNGKRVWPKLGGKSALIICEDAPNIARAAEAAAWGAFFNQGQMCTGSSRILVHKDVKDRFLEAVCSCMDRLLVGDPLEWATDIGPLVSPSQADDISAMIEDALSDGATVIRGGLSRPVIGGGTYLPPTLLDNIRPSSLLFAQEAFGPVASVLAFENLAEALTQAMSPGYGMALSVWTSSLNCAFELARRAKVGTVWINCFEADDMSVPFGGAKKSGYGRDKSFAALEKYSDLKTTWIQLDDSTQW